MALLARLFGLIYLASAALQYNDPDPLPWVLLYGAAGLACLLPLGRGIGRHAAAFVAAIALGWAVVLAPGIEGVAPADLTSSMQAKDGKVEIAREVGGLALIFVGMIFVREADRRTRTRRAIQEDWVRSDET